jgi:hypothetical protein
MNKKNNQHLETFTQWLRMIYEHIQTYRRVILESENPGDSISDFAWLYRKSLDSYFLSILRNLIDRNGRTSSICTFSNELREEEIRALSEKVKNKRLLDSDFSRFEKFEATYQKIDSAIRQIRKDYNCWTNEYNSHLNTGRLSSFLNVNEGKIKRPNTSQVTDQITQLIFLFQELQAFSHDDENSRFSSYEFMPCIEYSTKIYITETEK